MAAPDERYATPAEIEARHDPVLEEWLAALGVKTSEERVELLEALLFLDYARGGGTLAELPFAAPDSKDDGAPRIVGLPAALVYRTCGSNGMASGTRWKSPWYKASPKSSSAMRRPKSYAERRCRRACPTRSLMRPGSCRPSRA